MKLTKRGPGLYSVVIRFVTYLVEKHKSGWRWRMESDASTGGEWRATRHEAVLDLASYTFRDA